MERTARGRRAGGAGSGRWYAMLMNLKRRSWQYEDVNGAVVVSEPLLGESVADACLIEASIDSPDHFASIFDRHARAIHGYLSRRAGSQMADDLLSEVFVAAFEARGRYDLAYADARPWLYGIAGNVTKRHYRRAQRQLDLHDRLPRVRELDPSDEVVTRLDASRACDRLEEALKSLSSGDREALLLFAWEDLSYDEIAQALGIPIGTVRSRLNRARRLLRSADSSWREER